MIAELLIDPRRQWLPDLRNKYSLQIQSTTSCNARCIFCPHAESWGRQPAMRMPEELFEKILSEMQGFRFYKIAPYLQSEPLCDPRIYEWIGMIASRLEYDLIEISTNPAILDKSKGLKLADSLKSIPHEIRISFHGVDKGSFENNMGLPFAQSLDNIRHFLHLACEAGLNVTIKALGYSRGDIQKDVFFFGVTDFRDFWKGICKEENLPYEGIHFKYGACHNRSANLDRTARGDMPPVRPDLTGFYCTRADKWFHITHNGEMILCCNDYFREEVMGNLAESSIRDILNSKRYRDIIAKVRGEMESEENFLCKRCASPGG